MTDFPSAAVIAGQLSRGQASTIRGLDTTPAMLGCAEATAARMTKANSRRPALTVETPSDDGPLYSLNAVGVEVKTWLEPKASA